MRDYFYAPDDGPRVAVANLPTWQIEDLLAGELILTDDVGTETVDDVRERLRIELVVRGMRDV